MTFTSECLSQSLFQVFLITPQGFCDTQIPTTLPPLWETLGTKSTKCDVMKYF